MTATGPTGSNRFGAALRLIQSRRRCGSTQAVPARRDRDPPRVERGADQSGSSPPTGITREHLPALGTSTTHHPERPIAPVALAPDPRPHWLPVSRPRRIHLAPLAPGLAPAPDPPRARAGSTSRPRRIHRPGWIRIPPPPHRLLRDPLGHDPAAKWIRLRAPLKSNRRDRPAHRGDRELSCPPR